MTIGLIEVVIDGLETTYTPSCQCGWTASETATIEWSEFAIIQHHAAAHAEATA